MDVESLLQSVIRFSNFMTSRLIVSGVVFYIASGFTDIGSTSEGLLPDMDLLNQVVENYQNIFDVLGVSDFALLLILFVFLTTIHIIYVVFEGIGEYLPPAIIPLPGSTATDDVTLEGFDILREARGEEHTDEENQRLYEFRKKLDEIEKANDEAYAAELAGTNEAFHISKTFVLFSAATWLYAILFGTYSGDTNILLVILALSLASSGITAFSLFKANHSRIATLRNEVIGQFLGFSRIWLSPKYQAQVEAACVPSRAMKPAHFAIVVPIYGTLDLMLADVRRWRRRSQNDARRAAEQKGGEI